MEYNEFDASNCGTNENSNQLENVEKVISTSIFSPWRDLTIRSMVSAITGVPFQLGVLKYYDLKQQMFFYYLK